MSVRQYIGARYVPRFSDVNNGNWSSVYSYEPLIIVKNGNDYYTSKKSVPVGVQITNTEYWVKTGDYNGAIASLQSQINTINTNIDGVQGDVDDLSDNIIPGIETQIQNILDDMVDVQQGPGIYSGTVNVTDNDIHTVGSVTLEAGKLYMLYTKCDFEIAAGSTSGEHYIEQEVSVIQTPESMGRSRLSWSGDLINYTSFALARVVSISNVWVVKPSAQTIVYMHIRDLKTNPATVNAYPSIQAINFD